MTRIDPTEIATEIPPQTAVDTQDTATQPAVKKRHPLARVALTTGHLLFETAVPIGLAIVCAILLLT